MSVGRRTLVALLLALGTSVVFLPALANDFVAMDDSTYVTANPMVRQGPTAEGFRWSLTANVAGNWHPLTLWSHMLDAGWYGPRALGHHLTSVLLHAANAALLFLVLVELTGAAGRAAAVAAVWAWHPLRVESVAWIAERKDVLSGLFFLLTLLAYARFARRGSRAAYAAALGALALGLMAKPMLVTTPCVLLLLDVWPLGRLRLGDRGLLWRRVREKLPFFALSAASVWATLHFQSAAMASAARFPMVARIANAIIACGEYLRATVWPSGLAAMYPLPDTLDGARLVVAIALLAAVSAWAWRRRAGEAYGLVGWCWFLGMLVPVLGIFQVGSQAWADRYSYLPSIGLLIAIVWPIVDVADRAVRKVSGLRASVLLGALLALTLAGEAAATRRQIATWHDDLTLWRRAVAVTQENYVAEVNLGAAEMAARHLGPALEHFQRATRLAPESMEARAGYGDTLRLAGQPAAAAAELREAVRLRPADPRPHLSLALALVDAGDRAGAVAELRQALTLDPGFRPAADLLLRLEGTR